MALPEFTHLHVHSEYSILDGPIGWGCTQSQMPYDLPAFTRDGIAAGESVDFAVTVPVVRQGR